MLAADSLSVGMERFIVNENGFGYSFVASTPFLSLLEL